MVTSCNKTSLTGILKCHHISNKEPITRHCVKTLRMLLPSSGVRQQCTQ